MRAERRPNGPKKKKELKTRWRRWNRKGIHIIREKDKKKNPAKKTDDRKKQTFPSQANKETEPKTLLIILKNKWKWSDVSGKMRENSLSDEGKTPRRYEDYTCRQKRLHPGMQQAGALILHHPWQ